MVTPSFMFKRNIKLRFNIYNGGFEDHYFLMQISKAYGPIIELKLPLVFLHKNSFGESGLSSKMWFMQKGYFIIYRQLFLDRQINAPFFCFLIIFSIIKYFRRLIIVFIRKIDLKIAAR